MGVPEDMRSDFPAQNPQRDLLQVLVVCGILYVIAVTVTEKQSASAAVPEALGKGKGFDLPAQVEKLILHIHIPGGRECFRGSCQLVVDVPGFGDVDHADLEVYLILLLGD